MCLASQGGSMRVGATLASLNGRMPPNSQLAPRKPKIDAMLMVRGVTTPGWASPGQIRARPVNWFLLHWLKVPPVAFPSCPCPSRTLPRGSHPPGRQARLSRPATCELATAMYPAEAAPHQELRQTGQIGSPTPIYCVPRYCKCYFPTWNSTSGLNL